jgi:hypothetical protein
LIFSNLGKWLKPLICYKIGVKDTLREFFLQMHKIAVVSCVESILMPISDTKYRLVVTKLRSYDTAISESFDRVEYLKIILKEVYGNDYSNIITDIKICLGDLVEEEDIAKFFEVLES